MPARVIPQSHNGAGTASASQARVASNSVAGDPASGEGPARKRLQKTGPAEMTTTTKRSAFPISRTSAAKSATERAANLGRRKSVREPKAPLGPRSSDYLPSKSDNTYNPSHLPSNSFAASQSSTSLRSNVDAACPKPQSGNISDVNQNDSEFQPGSVDLLPTVNFDELHHSIKSNDLELSQAAPVAEGTQRLVGGSMADVGSMPFEDRQRGVPANSQPGRVGRSGSILHRQTNGLRENHQAVLGSTGSALAASETLHVASRLRGENQAQLEKRRAMAYRNRKSVGPGVLDYAVPGERGPQNRPAVGTAGVATNAGERTIPFSAEHRQTVRAGSLAGLEQPRLVAISRHSKAKSFHPTARDGSSEVVQPSETLEFPSSAVPAFARSLPWNPYSLPTSASLSSLNRRMSMIPPHATGLGARTISPTDARRMQRMSMLPDRPPMPDVPITPQPDVGGRRSAAHSPSMIPRKSVTPSSSRNTPDVSRRFHTHGAQASTGVVRNHTGGLPPRLSQASSTSRLPTLKTRNVHSSAGGEEVPPVPAIPKAYESPRETVERPFFAHGSSISAFGSASAVPSERTTHGLNSKILSGTDADSYLRPGSGFDPGNSAAVASSLKNRGHLQPLRLPPLNVLPLSGSTVERVAALQEPAGESSEGRSTPHPKRGPKTPSTPMTASKVGFFSKVKTSDEPGVFGAPSRSGSSNLLKNSDATLREASALGSHALSNEGLAPQSVAFGSHPVSGDIRSTRPAGPRAPTFRETEGSPLQKSASPTTLTAPPAPSSLRRKWSLSFRRSSSKASNLPGEPEPTQAPPPSKHELMPPPRLPASASFPATSASTPSPTNYLMSNTEQRFRKSSATSLLLSGLERAPANNWNGPPKVRDAPKEIEQRAPVIEAARAATRAASVTLSSAPRVVNSRAPPSSTPNKDVDPNLDPEDIAAEMEMKKLVSRRRDIELAAHEMDDLRRRAAPKEKITPAQALRLVRLNIFERGEIVDYKDIYFCGTPGAKKHVGDLNSPPTNFGYDDERGDYIIVKGDHLAYRYEVIDVLGKGSFGQVVRCVDHKNGGLVAVKIIRNKKRFHQQALIEVNILRKLREWDPNNKHGMVNFTQSFYFRGHLCISTELLGMNLYEFIKYNDFHGFSLKLIRRFTKQLLSSLILLHSHRIIHCDLKPENVLLAHPGHSEIKVIDFGSSCFETEKVYTYIQSRFYRSPEVILGMTYGMPIDIWSLGCILAELYTGSPIFPGENEQEQLACIMEIFGPPEKHLIEKSSRKKLFFDSYGKPRTIQFSKGRRRRPSSKTLQQTLRCDDDAFMDFIARCLRWDPERRLKPDEAMRHEFITGIKKPPPAPRNRAGAVHAAHAAHHAAGGSAAAAAAAAAGDASASAGTTFRRPGAMQAAAAAAAAPSSALRPLPDPPATYFKHSAGAARTRDARATGSPTKAAAAARRHSTVHGMQANAGVKRTSTGAPVGSTLPRVGPRASLANKGELATAAAATASIAQRR